MNRTQRRAQEKQGRELPATAPPTRAFTLFAMATAHHRAGRIAEAEGLYRQVLAIDPNHAESYHYLGVLAFQIGRNDIAEAMIAKAITLQGAEPAFHCSLGNALWGLGRLDEAVAAQRKALALKPDFVEAHVNLGNALKDQGRLGEAILSYRRALALKPDFAIGHNSLGAALKDQGKPVDAEASYRKALALTADYPEAHSNLGVALTDQGRLDEAIASFRRALNLRPDFAEAHYNLGNTLRRHGNFDEAAASYKRALSLKPDFVDAHYNLGEALQDDCRFEEALASYDKALALMPDRVDARWNRAVALLTLGRYAEGWREHEWRWRRSETPPRNYMQPLWRGEPLDNRAILLHAEQGMGDIVQFLRYAPLVAARGGRVTLQAPAAVARLARASLGDRAQVVVEGDALPAFDLHCPLLSLPLAFATTLDTIPGDTPYLSADPAAAALWRERLGEGAGLKVGLVWAGNPRHKNDHNRSIAFDRLAPLFGAEGVRWFSLQVGERRADLARLPTGTIADLSDGLVDLADTAAAISALDLVIAVDTAVAHLAGALAKPVWLLVPLAPDWRWLIGRDDSPYYPTARLFRQPARGDWDSVASRVREALDGRVESFRVQATAEPGLR
jgi:tetratricopeptide (TPR) repeat protein